MVLYLRVSGSRRHSLFGRDQYTELVIHRSQNGSLLGSFLTDFKEASIVKDLVHVIFLYRCLCFLCIFFFHYIFSCFMLPVVFRFLTLVLFCVYVLVQLYCKLP